MISRWRYIHTEIASFLSNEFIVEEGVEGHTLVGVFDEELTNDVNEVRVIYA